MIVVGIGFSSAATAPEIAELVLRCLDGRAAACLAIPEPRAAFPQAADAARLLDLPLVGVNGGAIEAAQGRCLTPGGRAGLAVAEGAALAAAGHDSRLLGPRVATRHVTCALAA